MSVCKGCGAPLEWIDTAAGRSMPVDPEPVFVIEGEGRDRFITDEGEVITGRRALPEEERRELPVGGRCGRTNATGSSGSRSSLTGKRVPPPTAFGASSRRAKRKPPALCESAGGVTAPKGDYLYLYYNNTLRDGLQGPKKQSARRFFGLVWDIN